MATAKEEKDEQAFFAEKVKEQEEDERKHTMDTKDKPAEKRMTHRQAIEELTDLIGTPIPIVEAESLKRQLSTVGDPDTELAPEMEEAVESLKKRAKDKDKLTNPGRK
jgi:hypothetical protein